MLEEGELSALHVDLREHGALLLRVARMLRRVPTRHDVGQQEVAEAVHRHEAEAEGSPASPPADASAGDAPRPPVAGRHGAALRERAAALNDVGLHAAEEQCVVARPHGGHDVRRPPAFLGRMTTIDSWKRVDQMRIHNRIE